MFMVQTCIRFWNIPALHEPRVLKACMVSAWEGKPRWSSNLVYASSCLQSALHRSVPESLHNRGSVSLMR